MASGVSSATLPGSSLEFHKPFGMSSSQTRVTISEEKGHSFQILGVPSSLDIASLSCRVSAELLDVGLQEDFKMYRHRIFWGETCDVLGSSM